MLKACSVSHTRWTPGGSCLVECVPRSLFSTEKGCKRLEEAFCDLTLELSWIDIGQCDSVAVWRYWGTARKHVIGVSVRKDLQFSLSIVCPWSMYESMNCWWTLDYITAWWSGTGSGSLTKLSSSDKAYEAKFVHTGLSIRENINMWVR